MVMIHHYAQYLCANGLTDSLFYKAMSFQAGYLGVAIFFFLSGFGLMESERKSHLNIILFIKRRILKVYLPVILASTIWMLSAPFFLSTNPFTGYQLDIGGGNTLVLSNILLNFGDGVLWFIKVLIVLYITFYVFSLILKLNTAIALIFLAICSMTLTYIFSSFEAISIPLFYFGILISLVNSTKSSTHIALSCIFTLLIFGFVLFLKASYTINILINISVIILLIIAFSIRKFDIKVPAILGLISFDIYLVHHKVIMVMRENGEPISLLNLLLMVSITSFMFYLLRTKVFKI